MSVDQTREQAHLSSDEGEKAREEHELHHDHHQIASHQELLALQRAPSQPIGSLTVAGAHLQEELRLEREQSTKLIQIITNLQEELRLEREQAALEREQAALEREQAALEREQAAQTIKSLQEELRLEREQAAQTIKSLQEELRLERQESARRVARIEQLQSRQRAHRISFQRLFGYFLALLLTALFLAIELPVVIDYLNTGASLSLNDRNSIAAKISELIFFCFAGVIWALERKFKIFRSTEQLETHGNE